MKITGKAHKFGRDIDTDIIIPANYLTTFDPDELAAHCMEPVAIKGTGVSAVIAKSFARIFFRNAINTGLPILESPEAVDAISDGDEVRVATDSGEITNVTTGTRWVGLSGTCEIG